MENNALMGVFPDLPNDTYHDDAALGSSGIKRFLVSPLHYWAAYLDPEREKIDKEHFRIGRAWHCAVFEPHAFGERFAVNHDVHPLTTKAKLLADCLADGDRFTAMRGIPDDIKLSTKEGKALAAEIEAAGGRPVQQSDLDFITEWMPKLSGRDVLSADHIEGVEKMARIARGLPISRVVFEQLAEHSLTEVSIFSVDPTTGVRLKIRPDFMLTPCAMFPNGLIIDGKSTTDASKEGFARQVWNLDYGLQASFYTSVFQSIFNTAARPPFMWLAQEKEAPHAAAYYSAGADLMAYWDKRIAETLPAIARCQEAGVWPGYPETVTELAMPVWAQKQIDAEAA